MLKFLREIKGIIVNQSAFQRGVFWNALSFIVMGVSGIVLNVLIVVWYGTAALGVFNQVYAIYILASQLGAFGIYASVLRHISKHSEDHILCSRILSNALILELGISCVVCVVYFYCADWVSRCLESEAVASGMKVSTLGLGCFAVNKTLLAFVNGKRFMKAFALFSIYRYVAMPMALVGLILIGLPGRDAPLVFTIAECTLLIALVVFAGRYVSLIGRGMEWLKVHLLFGAKSMIGGAVVEMNSRVDILMLGFFSGDKTVGIYSFAAMLAEGLDQTSAIFRVNYNPLLTKLALSSQKQEIMSVVKKFIHYWMPVAVVVGAVALLAYPLFISFFRDNRDLLTGWTVFAILLAGVISRSGYSVFWELPVQSGHPGYQTMLILMVTLGNVILNALLIPFWGMYGAAIATCISFMLSIMYLKVFVRKLLNIWI